HDLVRRDTELLERNLEPRCLAHTGGQDHHGPLVEDDLKLEAEVADDVEHRLLVLLRRRNDDPPLRQRRDTPLLEPLDEDPRRRLAEDTLAAVGGVVDHGAVLRDDPVENLEIPTNAL